MGFDSIASGNVSTALGRETSATAESSTALGRGTVASAEHSTAMGVGSVASGNASTAMGETSWASGAQSTAMGFNSQANGQASTAIGWDTAATADFSTAMGHSSVASGIYSTAMGLSNTASGGGSVAMGVGVTASGDNTIAMGVHASTNNQTGSFVYGDTSMAATTGDIVNATVPNEFVVRAAGGFRFRTSGDLSTGCNLPGGSGVWACTSSRHTKTGFERVEGEDLLRRLRDVPVMRWSYKTEPGAVVHIGPFAEDFHAAFGLGTSATSIGLQDIDGVNLAAIKALDARTRRLDEENAALKAELAALREAIARIGREK
jgi:hypothetical protein